MKLRPDTLERGRTAHTFGEAKLLLTAFACLVLPLTGCKRQAVPEPAPSLQVASSPAKAPSQLHASPVDDPASTLKVAKIDACALITKEEVAAIQGSTIKDTKSSERSDAGFQVSQCFYDAEQFTKSVSLSVTQSNPGKDSRRDVKQFWKETFGAFEQADAQAVPEGNKAQPQQPAGRGEEEEKAHVPPRKIPGVGEEAFWTAGIGAVLYVLKNDAFLRVSVGTAESDETRLDRCKALAQKALDRL